MTLEDILTFFDKQPYVGVMVYTDKIIYVNNKIEQLLGYSKEKILQEVFYCFYLLFPEVHKMPEILHLLNVFARRF